MLVIRQLDMSEEYFTIEQAAKKLGLSYKTIFRYIHAKKIEATKVGYWRIKKKELENFVKRSSNLRSK
jgi:excisionase family DNA binding protein